MSFDLGNIVGSIVKAVLPMAIDAVAPEADPAAAHHAAGASPSSGATVHVSDPLSNFVATNGLHSIARQ